MTEFAEKLRQGNLARLGLLGAQDILAASDLVKQVEASDLETVRVLFADQHGVLRGKTIVSDSFLSVFTTGISVPSTLLLKDTSHRTVFPIWTADNPSTGVNVSGAGDILLVPDANTFRVLSWTDKSAWIFCSPFQKTGEPITVAPRGILQNAIDRLSAEGLALKVGLEVEFHVFEIVDPKLEHKSATMPGEAVETRNIAQGYQYLTEYRYDALEDIMNDIRRHSQAISLPVRSMEIEMGPGQLEFTFEPSDPMTHADNMMMFRALVKEVCARQGLHGSFMCRPNIENTAANGWHLHQSLVDLKTGKNVMVPPDGKELSETASSWIAGLLKHANESCLLTTPTVNGYKRYRPNMLAPDRIQWGKDNRGALIRGLMSPGDDASRVENRVAESTANPYYFFASQILSGLDGLKHNLTAPEAVETPYDADVKKLPVSLLDAIQAFEASDFYREELGDVFVDYLSKIRRSEWDRYHLAVSEWEQAEYFGLY